VGSRSEDEYSDIISDVVAGVEAANNCGCIMGVGSIEKSSDN